MGPVGLVKTTFVIFPFRAKDANMRPMIVCELDGDDEIRLSSLILGMQTDKYIESFERTNLCSGKWNLHVAKKRAHEFTSYGGTLILLGSKVARAFEFRPFEPFTVHDDGGKTLILPHPSGLNRLWNEPGAITRARGLVSHLCPEVADHIGQE